jgi:RimJ/RimL family protein N-acetyltransferase
MSEREAEKEREPAELTTPRLVVRRFPWEAVRAIAEGRRLAGWASDYPTEGDGVIARILFRAGPTSAAETTWGHFQVLDRSSGRVIGGVGFLGPPVDGKVEIGYGIAPSCQGRGYATEAVEAMVAIASADAVVTTIVAGTDPDNLPSQRVLEKVGFRFVERSDVLRYALEVSP